MIYMIKREVGNPLLQQSTNTCIHQNIIIQPYGLSCQELWEKNWTFSNGENDFEDFVSKMCTTIMHSSSKIIVQNKNF